MSCDFRKVIESAAGGVCLRVKVVPGASRSAVVGVLGDRLKIAVAAPPEGGKANKAVCTLLAGVFGVGVRQVEVVSGMTRPQKQVSVAGVCVAEVEKYLSECCG